MTTFITIIHSIVCILLATIILMQSGRKGGLTESFAAAESMLGAQTNSFMVKATSVLATLFLLSCLTLAFLSFKKDQSLLLKRSKVTQSTPVSAQEDVERFGAPVEQTSSNVITTP